MTTEQKVEKKPLFYPVTLERVLEMNDLTGAELKVLLYVRAQDPFGDLLVNLPPTEKIQQDTGLSKSAIHKAIKRLINKGFFSEAYINPVVNRVENKIRDRLHVTLGGLVEVNTPAGRIDLLTQTEVIEVKYIKDWKAALGQVLAYSGFYPQHLKRLHLFGSTKDLKILPHVEAAVLSFSVRVTSEEV